MRSLFIILYILLTGPALLAQTERVAGTTTLNPVKCPTLTAQSAFDLCVSNTITPGIQIPQGATINYSWTVAPGAVISGPVNQLPLVILVGGGTYTLAAANSTSGCTAIKTYVVIDCPVGINENSDAVALISVYPNPCTTAFYLLIDGNAVVSFFNAYGQLLSTNNYSAGKQRVDVSGLAAGVYYLSITNGTWRKTLKVLKQ